MMMLGILVGALWLTSGALSDKFQCPGNANCECYAGDRGDIQLLCPLTQPTLIAHLLPKQYIQFQCTVMKNWEDLNLVSGLEIGPVKSFILRLCPLPGISFKELMATVGIPSAKTLQMQSHGNLSNTLTSRHLEGLQEVTQLNLANNALTELPEDLLKDLTNLTWLDLKNNNVQLPKGFFRYVPKLEVLELGSNNINYLEPGIFRNLTKLRLLNLWSNRLHNLTRSLFSDVPNLENLDLNSNGLTTLPPDLLTYLINLKNINLNGNEFVSLPQSLFQSNSKLERIQINNNRRTLKTLPPGFLQNLKNLRDLSLRDNNLTSLPEDLLWGCTSLENLTLQRNLLTELPEKIFRDIKQVTMINMSYNKLQSLPDSLLSSLEYLKILDISHNKLTNLSESLFSSMFRLETLHISHNQIQFIHPEAFAVPVDLKTLDLSYNQLSHLYKTGAVENSILQGCNKLEVIDLAHNNLTIIYDDWRFSKLELQVLDLSYNNFTTLPFDDMQFLSSRLSVDLSHNSISLVSMHKADIIARAKYEGFKNPILENTSVKINLNNNPFICDCNAYYLAKYFKDQLYPYVKYIVELDGSNLTCAGPDELKGSKVAELDPRLLKCPLKSILNAETKEECPQNCTCHYRPSNSALIVDCSYRGLKFIPPSLPTSFPTQEWMEMNHTELDLSGNQLTSLPIQLGKGYSKATKIYLSDNNLTQINLTSFSQELQVIELSNNNLTRMDADSLKMLEKSKFIEKVTLVNNPWTCDCQAKTFLSYIQANFNKIPNLKNITCANGTPFSELTVNDLCPAMNISTIIIISTIVAILGLLIGGSAALYYRFQREIKVWLYAHQLCLWFVTEEELDKDKVYDAFISYSHQDEKFVVEDLVPGLENGPTKFKLCLHYRDWVVGEFIPNQITRSVEESRRTVVVLSPNFLESVWGRMEFRAAHSQALSEGRARVIIILYGDIGSTENLDPELKAYLSMNTYVKWGDPWFWEKLRYALPHPPELSKGIPLLSRQTILGIQGAKLINGTDPNSPPPALTTPPADTLIIDPLKTLANSKPV